MCSTMTTTPPLILMCIGYISREFKGFKYHQQLSILRGKIDAEVRLNPNFKKTLLKGLLEALEDKNWLYCALLPMYVGTNDDPPVISASGSDTHSLYTQESFIKVLLGIDSLQPDVISAILECLPDLATASDDETKGDGLLNLGRHVSLPHLVLQQLRWIDHIVNPSALTDKLLDCAMVLNVGLQRYIVSYLSDIVQDAECLRVVESLEGLLTLEESLLPSILDAYASMNLPVDVLTRIARSMMERLPSIEPTVLPVLVRFLLETSASCKDPDLICDFLKMVRENVNFADEYAGGNSTAPWHVDSSLEDVVMLKEDDMASGNDGTLTSRPTGEAADGSFCSLALEELFQGLKMRPCVATTFFKILDEIKYPRDHRPFDVWVLFCLHDTPQYSRKALSVIRKKVTAGEFSHKLLYSALQCQIGAFGPLFQSLLALADTLVRVGGGKVIRKWGVCLYSLLFNSCTDLYHRQETLGGVLAHAGSGLHPEVQCALEVLESIPPSALQPFAALVKGLLEFMQSFSDRQVRCIFQILCNLMGSGHVSGSMDDMHIYIRKNLSLRDMTFKRFGIIGAVSYVVNIGNIHLNSGKGGCESDRDAISMLSLIRIHTKNQPEAAAFGYDELCMLILAPNVSAKVAQWVTQESSTQLERAFLVEPDDDDVFPPADSSRSAFDGAVKLRLTHRLNEQDNPIAVNFMQVLCSRENRTRMKATYLIPVLGLALVSSLTSEGSLAYIDTLIGAPFVLPDQESINAMSTMEAPVQEAICWAYYYALDWCRELLNSFAGDLITTATKTTGKIVSRLGTLVELEGILVFLLKRNPDFVRNHMEGLLSGGVDAKKKGPFEKHRGKQKGKVSSSVESEELIRNYLHVTMRPLGHRVPCILASSEFKQVLGVEYTEWKLLGLRLLLGELHRHISSVFTPSHATHSIAGMAASLNSKLLLIHSVSQPLSSPPPPSGLQLLQLYLDAHVFSSIGQHLKDIKVCLEGGNNKLNQEAPQVKKLQHAMAFLYIILKIIKLLTSSEEFKDESSTSIVLKAIGAMALGGEMMKNTGNDVCIDLSDVLFSISTFVPSLSLTVEVCETIDTLLTVWTIVRNQQQLQHTDSPRLSEYEIRQRLGKVCLSLLGRDWSHSEEVVELTKKSPCNGGTLQVLASLYLRNMAASPLDCDLSRGGIDGANCFGGLDALDSYCNVVLGAEVEGTLNGYPSLTKKTFVFFYKPAMIALIKVLKDLELDPESFRSGVNENNDSHNSNSIQVFVLDNLKWSVAIFSRLIGFTRVNHGRQVLAIALKEGRRFMTELLRHMKILDDTFSKHQEKVLDILNSVQPATRQMHILISYAKRSRDKSMVWEAPKCRKILEKFIFRVKKILQTNNCMEAMFVGNLKARNLDGTLGNPDESPSESDESESDQEDAQFGGCTSSDEKSDNDSSDLGVEIGR